MRETRCITGSGKVLTHNHTMPDTREPWQQQSCEGTAEAKDIPGSVVSGSNVSEIDPSESFFLVG